MSVASSLVDIEAHIFLSSLTLAHPSLLPGLPILYPPPPRISLGQLSAWLEERSGQQC